MKPTEEGDTISALGATKSHQFLQGVKEKVTPVFHKLFQAGGVKGMLLHNSAGQLDSHEPSKNAAGKETSWLIATVAKTEEKKTVGRKT